MNVTTAEGAPEIRNRLNCYPEYKDSGVEWLGEIPTRWLIKPLKYVVEINPEVLPENTDVNYTFKYIDISSVKLGECVAYLKKFRFLDAPSRARWIIRKDDVIVSTVRTYLKSIAHFRDPEPNLIASTGFAVIRSKSEINPRYLYYQTRSDYFVDAIMSNSEGIGYPAINSSVFGRLSFLIPSIPEQRAIAAFLDRKTAHIDVLIEKKRRLINLLEEKRTALISHAITKGLDPNAPMKYSGVEWLGDIPAGWNVKRLKHVTSRIGSGKTPKGGAEVYCDSGIIFLRSQNIHFDELHLDDVVYIDENIDSGMVSTRVMPEDILLNITGASIGRCSVVPQDFPRANVNQHVCIIRPIGNQMDPNYLHRALCSGIIQSYIFSIENGTSREGLTFSQIANFVIVSPKELDEQRAIADFLNHETTKIDVLISKINEVIDKLQEYRTALISAAVTGKIDLRTEEREGGMA